MTDLTTLVVVVPSRGRPEAIEELRTTIAMTSEALTALYAVVDRDDPRLEEYLEQAEDDVAVVDSEGMVAALNEAARLLSRAGWDALGFMGDDHRPRTPGWDRRLLEALSELGTGIAYGNDLLMGERMPTAVAMTSDIVRALGYMAPPTFRHLNVDLVWKEWGDRIGRLRYLDDVVIEHLHPAIGKAVLDAGYERVNSVEMVARDGFAWDSYVVDRLDEDVLKLRDLLEVPA
jgi:hypothetical protein